MKKLKNLFYRAFSNSHNKLEAELMAYARSEYKNDTTFAIEMVRTHGLQGIEKLKNHFGNK